MNKTAVVIIFVLGVLALKFYQPVEVAVYECSEHPDFHPSRESK